jgi:hypothetical protein
MRCAQRQHGGRALRHRREDGQLGGGDPAGVHGHAPRPVPAQHRHREQGEPDLARQHRGRPAETGEVGAPPALHQHGACRHDQGGQHRSPRRPPALQHRADEREHHRHARHRDPERRRLRVLRPAHQRDVEQHEPERGHPEQPQPLRPPRHPQRHPGHAGQREEQERGRGVADRLDGEQRGVGQHAGHGDTAPHARHGHSAHGERTTAGLGVDRHADSLHPQWSCREVH